MRRKRACLIINPRSGKNVARLTDVLAVFSAAGWKIDTVLKEFGGHTLPLARHAADAGYDLLIGYGGDGTLNQIVNGVMTAKHHGSTIGVIPGGTANVWAHEIGVPEDPVKAALLLINSEGRHVDLGHVELESLPLPLPLPSGLHQPHKPERPAAAGRHHFLLMAGLGVDAAILRRVSTTLKERIGGAAVALAAIREWPARHGFPIEIRSAGAGSEEAVLWGGEALQVVVGNTRRYGNIAELTPAACIDDGILDVCVITAGNPLATVGQILSALLHRQPRQGRSEYFRGAHFRITVPASVDLQLDGSRVKLKNCQAAPDRTAFRRLEGPHEGMVTYRFDAVPRALSLAIPRAYDGPLFAAGSGRAAAPADEAPQPDRDAALADATESGDGRQPDRAPVGARRDPGRRLTVIGAVPNPERPGTSIVAGVMSGKNTGEFKPVAVRIDRSTTLVGPTGADLPATAAAQLPEGVAIVAEGRRSKRGVIRAKHVVVMS
jgi:YegS/Rv2252/BmrU family lipid kinase